MFRFLAIVVLLSTLLMTTGSQATAQVDNGFQSIFNGQDLTGWEGDPRLWRVNDGVIRGQTTTENQAQRNTFLIWNGGEVGDFELKLSYRCNATNNSGVQYRSQKIAPFKQNRWRVKGYQHEIRNQNSAPDVSGFIYDEGGKRNRICLAGEKAVWNEAGKKLVEKFVADQDIEKLIRIDQWNEIRILAIGTHIQHFLNGKKILDFTDDHPQLRSLNGVLALQLHAGAPMWVEFKNIMLRPIESKAPAVAGFTGAHVWPNIAPGETTANPGVVQPANPKEKPGVTRITKVTRPTYSFYPADQPNGSAVLVVPGGGFQILAADLEGTEIAEWLNGLGFHAFVLHYRVAGDGDVKAKLNKAVQDTQRTIATIRSKATEYKIDPRRVGVIGFSAGGLTTASVLAANGELAYAPVDAIDQQPATADFAMLIYPALSGVTIGPHFPPTFMVHTHDDFVPSEDVAMFYAKLKKADVVAELHIFANGGHGYGLRPKAGSNVSSWPDQAAAFLKRFQGK